VNSISFKHVSFLLGLAALTVASNPMSVRAETSSTTSAFEPSELASAPVSGVTPAATNPLAINSTSASTNRTLPIQTVVPNATGGAIIDQLGDMPTTTISGNLVDQFPGEQANLADSQPLPQASINKAQDLSVAQPQLEKLETSAGYLTAVPSTSPVSDVSSNEANTAVAQNVDITPGRATRGGSSYIGIAGNLGLSGDTGLGDGAFVINSKIGLTRNVSFRPAVAFGDDTDFLLPLTYDFVIESADPFAPIPFAPYLGGGVILSTNGDNDIGFLLTGGVDVPLSTQFVANASINVGFRNDTDVGLFVGVGYTFPGFSR